MKKIMWKPGTMVYPVPAAMVSCGHEAYGNNIITIAWTGTINSDPAMTYVSIRKERYSYDLIKKAGYFVINLTTEDLAFATDYCGVKSGKEVDKFKELKLTPHQLPSGAIAIGEAPVSIECQVTEIKELGSHDMFFGKVLGVHIDPAYLDKDGGFHLDWAKPLAYAHGKYYGLGKKLGKFGYSVEKKKTKKKRRAQRR